MLRSTPTTWRGVTALLRYVSQLDHGDGEETILAAAFIFENSVSETASSLPGRLADALEKWGA
jgi:hypothetical protein